MAKELDAELDHGDAELAGSCKTESGSVSFLERVIGPIYEIMKAVRGSLFSFSIILNLKYCPFFICDCDQNMLDLKKK